LGGDLYLMQAGLILIFSFKILLPEKTTCYFQSQRFSGFRIKLPEVISLLVPSNTAFNAIQLIFLNIINCSLIVYVELNCMISKLIFCSGALKVVD